MLGCEHIFLMSFLECFRKISKYRFIYPEFHIALFCLMFALIIFSIKIEHNHNLFYSSVIIRKHRINECKVKWAKLYLNRK